jgi:2'-phosphotransferase
MDSKGFINVDEILKKCNNINFDQIKQIVDTNNKKRFELENRSDGWYIRAVQGHTIQGIDPDLQLVTDANEIPIVVHGTNIKAYESIEKTGLNRMERNHIHFAHGTLDDKSVISGMRKTAKVMIYIDVPKAMAAGIKFYKSSNGVILSEGINGVINSSFFCNVEFIP